jgi:hypothetical protein
MKTKRIILAAGTMALAAILLPLTAHAFLDLDIFEAILGNIKDSIGTTLNDINQVRSAVVKTEQQVLYPLAVINQQRNYISTVKSVYRAWMNQVFELPVNSATLPSSKSLETAFLSASSAQISNFGKAYLSTYGAQPASGAAPAANLQMMDIEDATARDATAQSMAADQSTVAMLQTAQRIEDETQTTAPGTADMVAATARTAELASLAMQHKLLAYQLREAAMELGHRGAVLKQSVGSMQNLNQQILRHLGGSQ